MTFSLSTGVLGVTAEHYHVCYVMIHCITFTTLLDRVMNSTKRLLVALVALLIGTQAWAQVDTNSAYSVIYGRLVKAASSELTIEGADATGNISEQVFTLDGSTFIDGCTIDKVIPGTQLLVYVSARNTATNVAGYVKFYGCEPSWQFTGEIVGLESGILKLEGRDAASPSSATATQTLRVSSETMYFSCYGVNRTAADFPVGTQVTVSAIGPLDNLRAEFVASASDCGESKHVEGSFVSFADSVLSLDVEGQADQLRIVVSGRFTGTYLDSSMSVYSCSGETVRLVDVRPGERLNVLYVSLPDQGDFLQYAQLQRDCPFTISGTITRVDGRTITIAMNGDVFEARLTDETGVQDCSAREASADALVVGTSVAAYVIPGASGNTVLKIQINSGCPYAFYIGGTVTAVSPTSVTINGIESRGREGNPSDVELELDAASFLLDCLNQPLTNGDLQVGSTVAAYYRTSGEKRVLDLVTVMSPCNAGTFDGLVLEATPSSITVNEADGSTRTFAIGAGSILTDCSGATIEITPAIVGAKVNGTILTSTSPASITWATFYVGCPVILNDGGIITRVSDSTLTFNGASGAVELQRSQNTAVFDSQFALTEWSALSLGDTVCTWYDDNSKLAYRVVSGTTCSALEGDIAKPMIGVVVRAADGEMTIKNTVGEMSFAVTPNTNMITTSRSSVNASDLSAGMRVSVMSTNFNRQGQPVATSVTVMASPTSVDEESTSSSVTISPNPASDVVTIGNQLPGEMVTLYDQRGNRVMRFDTPSFNVSSLAPGVYSVVRENGASVQLVIIR